MGFKFRKSFKVAPGVRVNIGKKSASVSVGTKEARRTYSTSGRKTTTISVPGTGVAYTTSTSKKGKTVKPTKAKIQTTTNFNQKPSTATNSAKTSTTVPKGYSIPGIIMIILGIAYGCVGIKDMVMYNSSDLFVGSCVILCIGIILMIRARNKKKNFQPSKNVSDPISVYQYKNTTNVTSSTEPPDQTMQESKQETNLEPILKYPHTEGFSYLSNRIVDDAGEQLFAKYKYYHVPIDISKSTFREIFDRDYVDIRTETIIDSTVANIFFHNEFVGTIYNKKICKMVSDFMQRGEIVKGQIDSYGSQSLSATIFFYKKVSDYLHPVDPFTVKLIRTGSEEIQDNISICSVGEKITIEEVDDKYLVWSGSHDIGCIPKSKHDYVDDLMHDGYEFAGTITKIEENDNLKYFVWVEVQPY